MILSISSTRLSYLTILLVTIHCYSALFADIRIEGGTITDDDTWDDDVEILGDITLEAVIEVEPPAGGLTIRFGGNTMTLGEEGQFLCTGTDEDKVTITNPGGIIADYNWSILKFDYTDIVTNGSLGRDDAIFLSSCQIFEFLNGSITFDDNENGNPTSTGIHISTCNWVDIRNSEISNLDDACIQIEYVEDWGDIEIVNNKIKSTPVGIEVDHELFSRNIHIEISENEIDGNTDGIYIHDLEDYELLEIEIWENTIFNGVTGVRIDDVGSSEITIEQNIIHSNSDDGIRINENVSTNCVINNNIIYSNSGGGIVIDGDNNVNTKEHPYVYNNSLFKNTDYGIWCDVENNSNGTDLPIFQNNVCWDNTGEGYCFFFQGGADIDDVSFLNNMAGGNGDESFYSNIDPGENTIKYFAIKRSDSDYSNQADDIFDDSCPIDGGGDLDNSNWDLVDETPTSTGWDFHLLVDDVMSWSEFNALINAGSWSTEEDPDENPDDDNSGSRADIGVFGSEYATKNIDKDFNSLLDYCLVTTVNGFEDWPKVVNDYFRNDEDATRTNTTTALHMEASLIELKADQEFRVVKGVIAEDVLVRCYETGNIGGFSISDSVDFDSCAFKNVTVVGADYGFYMSGVTGTGRLSIDSCTIDDCEVGIYANNSRVEITDCEIKNSDDATSGCGIYLVSTTSGQVIIDGNDIHDNGTACNTNHAGIYLSSADAEIKGNDIYDNFGSGIVCASSSPDLDTWDSVLGVSNANTIYSNGEGTQSGSNGVEVYLDASSSPFIKYNNIYDELVSPVGYALYNANAAAAVAINNYWGVSDPTSYAGSLFYGTVTWNPYQSSACADGSNYATGMYLWTQGRYSEAAVYFKRGAYEEGADGMNSIRYLAGCVNEDEDGDLDALREFYQDVAGEHESDDVAKVAARFATHCLTLQKEYEDALDEYDDARMGADTYRDSILAYVDYLAVAELAGVDMVNALGDDIPGQMMQALSLLDNESAEEEAVVPATFSLNKAYPNPFNSTVNISYNLAEDGYVKLSVYDLNGRRLESLYSGERNAGVYNAVWEAADMPSGLYLARIEAEDRVDMIKMSLIR